MKPLIPILVVATTSLAVASVQFAQQASTQRKRADAEVLLRQKQEVRVTELERSQARLEQELATARVQNTPVPGPVAGIPRPAVASKLDERRPGFMGPPGMPPPPPQGIFDVRARNPFDSPAARNFMRTRMKSSIRRLYGDAGHALGLSDEKGNQLLDLIADQETRNMGGPPKLAEGQSFQQYAQEMQKKNNQEITNLIGADKAEDWAAYQKTLPQRAQLGVVADQLDQAGMPMSESQRTEMLSAISEETQRLPPRPSFQQGVPPEEMITQMNQWQTDYDKALMDRAKTVLNTDQYKAYKEYQDWQAEMRNNMPRGPNGAPGGVVMRSFSSSNGVAGDPTVGFSMAVPAQPVPAPAEPSRK
jgi:hypothetical protein